jgi:hypothetical protein
MEVKVAQAGQKGREAKGLRKENLPTMKTRHRHKCKIPGQILQELKKILFHTLIFSSPPADITVLKK